MLKSKKLLPAFFLLFFLSCSFLSHTPAYGRDLTPEAQKIYKTYNTAVVQIRVLSRSSNEKASIGSGFFFSDKQLIATNYHVISDAAMYPSLYYVECVMPDNTRGTLKILNIDPVHDIAILASKLEPEKKLKLGHSDLQNGNKIYSFGNPYDMGMIVVEGLFNGLLEHARYKKILFSGALNPGMSGGPALAQDGTVIGVNVSTATNNISFFVPVEFLYNLYNEVVDKNFKSLGPEWKALIKRKLKKEQGIFLNALLDKNNWNKARLGFAKVPGEISNNIKCWGRPDDNRKLWVKGEYLSCSTEDNVFISSTLTTGLIYYQYEWYKSRDLDPVRFYNILESYAANREFSFYNAQERDVANFACQQDFVDIDGRACKLEVCTRVYKNLYQLYDTIFQVTTTDKFDEGFVANGVMLGFSKKQSKSFVNRFLKEITWQK